MKHQFKIIDKGLVKPLTIEPSIYQGKHLYEIGIDGTYSILYHDGENWKCNDGNEMNPDLLNQVTDKIETLNRKLQA